MMKKSFYTIAVLIILITAGCAHYGELDQDYGNSYYRATNGQILNPSASQNPAPVTGLTGKAADAAMKKYAESFSASDKSSRGQQGVALTPIVPDSTGAGQNVYGK